MVVYKCFSIDHTCLPGSLWIFIGSTMLLFTGFREVPSFVVFACGFYKLR